MQQVHDLPPRGIGRTQDYLQTVQRHPQRQPLTQLVGHGPKQLTAQPCDIRQPGSQERRLPEPRFTLHTDLAAAGVQVYQCTAGSWAFLEPAAQRWDLGGRAAIHFRGPSWESIQDGSLVTGRAIASSPVPGSIPQLLLQATSTRGTGIFGAVTYIQRLATSGGTAPTTACTDGQTQGVPYTAAYRFYAAS